MTFDPKRRLVMATFKTVLGHNLPAGTTLTIVDEPSARGEVDKAMAARLFNSKNAVYFEDARPTPVESPDQEKARLAAEALYDAGPDGEVSVPADLIVWQEDDAETGRKKGDKVTRPDLVAIASREGVTFETDDNKGELTRKIVEHRAATVNGNATNSETAETVDAGGDASSGATGAESDGGAETGADGGAG